VTVSTPPKVTIEGNLIADWISYCRIMTIRMEQDRPVGARSIEEKFTWYQVYCALKSPHVLLAIGSLFMVGSNLYGLAYFEPSSE
jgi:hypothetical protein